MCINWQFWTEQDKIQKENSEARIQYEIQRRLQPQTEADFDILYKELETWQIAVTLQIPNLFQSEYGCCYDAKGIVFRCRNTVAYSFSTKCFISYSKANTKHIRLLSFFKVMHHACNRRFICGRSYLCSSRSIKK